MRRSSGAGGKAEKTRRHKTKPAGRVAPGAARRHGPAASDVQSQLDVRSELDEALKQQAATSEVLAIIASSPGELAPVFDAILTNAVRLCDAGFGNLALYDKEAFRIVGTHGAPPAWAEWALREAPVRPGPLTGLGRLMRTKQVVHIADYRAEQGYRDRIRWRSPPPNCREPDLAGSADAQGARTDRRRRHLPPGGPAIHRPAD